MQRSFTTTLEPIICIHVPVTVITLLTAGIGCCSSITLPLLSEVLMLLQVSDVFQLCTVSLLHTLLIS